MHQACWGCLGLLEDQYWRSVKGIPGKARYINFHLPDNIQAPHAPSHLGSGNVGCVQSRSAKMQNAKCRTPAAIKEETMCIPIPGDM
jgi:hypothetical protein